MVTALHPAQRSHPTGTRRIVQPRQEPPADPQIRARDGRGGGGVRDYPRTIFGVSTDELFKTMGSVTQDLRWTIKDIQTFGDQIVVRGEATGTPVGEFWGAKPTGKSFKTMAVDVFTVKNGKLASAYHVENWMTALQQISR